MSDIHRYQVKTTWDRARIGHISEETLPTIQVATPPEFPGGVPNIWSPEHLYVASASVCLMTTFLAIAENSKLEFTSYSAEATGKLEKADGKFQITEIIINPRIQLVNPEDKAKAERIIMKSESNCLISQSMKTTVIVKPTFE